MKRNYVAWVFRSVIVALTLPVAAVASHNPINATQDRTGWTSGLQDLNINNVVNNNGTSETYFFMASDNGSEPLNQNQNSDTSLGHRIISEYDYSGTGNFGIDIFPLRIGTPYFIYVESCEPGTVYTVGAITGGVCSNWVLINGGAVDTLDASTNPGFNNITKTNITGPKSLSIAMTRPIISDNSAQNWTITFTQHGTATTSGALPNPFSPNSGPYSLTINDAYFSGHGTGFTLSPNTAYDLAENILYKYSQRTNDYTPPITPFWTNPVDPANVTPTPTHFTVTVTWDSHGAGADNPTGTVYQLSMTGNGAPGPQNVTYTGSNPMTKKITGLQAGTAYNACVTALNTDANWNNSNSVCQSFTTLPINPTYSVTGVQTQQATFNVTLNPPTGITDYIVERCVGGVSGTCVQDSKTAWSGNSISDTMGSLTPNTAYEFYIQFFENADFSAFSPQPDAGQSVNQFTTTPADPIPTAFTTPSPRSLQAQWTDTLNPNGTVSEFQYCLDAGFSSGCHTALLTKSANGTQTITVTDGVGGQVVSPETAYYAHVRTRNVSRPTWPDTAYIPFANNPQTTPNEGPTIVSGPTVTVFTTSATLVVTATDNGGPGPLVFNWTVNPAAGSPVIVSAAGTSVISGPNVTNTAVLNFAASNPFNGNVTVTDHNGVGLQVTAPWSTTSATLIPTTVDPITPNPGQVVVNSPGVPFSATIHDQFGNVMTSGLTGVTWSVTAGVGAISIAPTTNSNTTTVTGLDSTINGGNATVKIQLANGQSQSVAITVKPAGILFSGLGNPSVTLIPDSSGVTTASLHCLATDNNPAPGSLHYSWQMETGPSPVGAIPTLPDTTVLFSAAGTYSFRCNVSDDAGSLGTAVTNSTTVVQVVGGLSVSPNRVTLQSLQNQVFSATVIDQFRMPMATPSGIQWTFDGKFSGSGAQSSFNSSVIGKQITITATDPVTGRSGAALATIISYDVSGAIAYPVPYKASFANGGIIHFKNLGTQWGLRIYTPSGRRIFDYSGTTDTYDWNIKNSSGENIASGVYFYVIESPSGKKDGKLIIIQ